MDRGLLGRMACKVFHPASPKDATVAPHLGERDIGSETRRGFAAIATLPTTRIRTIARVPTERDTGSARLTPARPHLLYPRSRRAEARRAPTTGTHGDTRSP